MRISDVIILKEEQAFIDAAVELLDNTSRYVRIRSAELDPALFDTPEFNEALSAFARRSRFSDVRILVDRPDVLLTRGHKTVNLMRRLTQKILIKTYHDEPNPYQESYILSDTRGLLIKYQDINTEGYYSRTDAVTTKKLIEKFDYDWERSSIARELRPFVI